MKSKAVLRIKLSKNPVLDSTFAEFQKAVGIAFKHRKAGGLKAIHTECYSIIRNETLLPSQLSCKAIRLVSQSRKAKSIGVIPIRYDIRNFWFRNNTISISTVDGRIKIPLIIPVCFNKYLDWNTSGADLVRKGNDFFIHIFVCKDIHQGTGTKIIGVDTGINKLAVTSNRQFYYGVENRLKRYVRYRAILQSKGTKSAKRHLKRLSGRQTRFMKDVNHNISKKIVESNDIRTIVMEDLTGIRNKNRGRRFNGVLSRWAFYQLQTFIEYKAIQKGIAVAYINPRNTSKTCSSCGSLDTIRNSGFFHCNTCNHSLDADFNASLNIANVYRNCNKAEVIQPIVAN